MAEVRVSTYRRLSFERGYLNMKEKDSRIVTASPNPGRSGRNGPFQPLQNPSIDYEFHAVCFLCTWTTLSPYYRISSS